MSDINKSFLGSGWSFPPRFSKATDGVEMSQDEADIAESIFILLSTTPGERTMNPDYGCDLQSQVFQSVNNTMKTNIKDIISKAILFFEPRVRLREVRVNEDDGLNGRVNITIDYEIRGTNSRKNIVYPFYLTEGTDVDL